MAGERRYIPASEFCESVRDGTHDSPKPVGQGRKLVTSRHIVGGRLDLSEAYLISDEDFDAIKKRSCVNRWDVLISMIGTVGEACLIKDEPDFAIKNVGIFKTRNEADGKWLYYFLRSPYAQQAIREQSRGTTQQYMPLGALRDFPILITDDPEEKNIIVKTLGSLDDKIELNRRMNETLEGMARALFQSWLVDFDPVRAKLDGRQPVGMDAETAALFPAAFQDSPLGPIPMGWEVGTVNDIAVFSRDSINPGDCPDESFDHYSLPAFDEGRVPKVELGSAIMSNKLVVTAVSILLSKLNPHIPRIWLPALGGVNRAICSTEFIVACAKAGTSREYLYSLFTNTYFSSIYGTLVTGTTGSHQRIKAESVLAMNVVFPPPEIIRAFTNVAQSLFAKMNRNIDQSRTLATLRDTLLPKLLSGELRVGQVERG